MSGNNINNGDFEPALSVGLLKVSDEASRINILADMDSEISQLEAMTSAIYGEGKENFAALEPRTRDNYLWAIHSKVTVLRLLFEAQCRAPNGT